MEQNDMIVRSGSNDWSLVRWASVEKSWFLHTVKLNQEDISLLLAWKWLVSDDDIFQDLMGQWRLSAEQYTLRPWISLSKPRTQDELMDLFSVGDVKPVYQEFIFQCERRRHFLQIMKYLIQHIVSLLNCYDINAKEGHKLSTYERSLIDRGNNVVKVCSIWLSKIDSLAKEYHTYWNEYNDTLYNLGWGVNELSFKETLLYNFSQLNGAMWLHDESITSVDAGIEDFIAELQKWAQHYPVLKKILSGQKIPYDTATKPLNKKEITIFNAVSFLK